MWVNFVRFMTGPFAGMTKLWEVVEERLAESAFDAEINEKILKILQTNPNVTQFMRTFSGAPVRTKNPMREHGLPIGDNFWIGQQVSLDGNDYCKIFICEDPETDIEEATLVYWDGVRIDGNWRDVIHALLDRSVDESTDLFSAESERKRDRDHDRANGFSQL